MTKIKKNKFLEEYENIPFRYIQLYINNKYLFKINEIDDNSEFEFKYLYDSFNNIIIDIRDELFKIIQNDTNILENTKKEIQPIN